MAYTKNQCSWFLEIMGTQYTYYNINRALFNKRHNLTLCADGPISQILIMIESQNKNCVYELEGIVTLDGKNIGFIDRTINKIYTKTTYEVSNHNRHVYVFPFMMEGRKIGDDESGCLFINGFALKIEFILKQLTDFKNDYVNIHAWCPKYEKYKMINEKFMRVNIMDD